MRMGQDIGVTVEQLARRLREVCDDLLCGHPVCLFVAGESVDVFDVDLDSDQPPGDIPVLGVEPINHIEQAAV